MRQPCVGRSLGPRPWIALEEERNERGGAVLEKQVPVWPPQFHNDIVCANSVTVCFPSALQEQKR